MAHLLQTPWTFYFFQKGKNNTDYSKCIQKVAKVTSVEEFWGAYSHFLRPDKLRPSFQLHFFRNDSRAMWEDEENKSGGAFLIMLQPSHASEAWEKLLLSMIGEQIDSDIIGAVIALRPDCHRLFVWNQTADLNFCQKLAGELFKILELPYKTKICYNPHSRFLSTDGSGQLITSTTYQYEADGPVMVQNNNK
ncbi:Eukaryotic translation initiation factor 4E type 2 [Tritrichomonas foetus]|uniref:Eukaryotic translation initiation factor 4E type 2 n=1 Tax=Tritrichomonas foetus TaxID=1144522 RepID=A0A1J4KLP3_9EUKA|nr:Eukaryotic translation initiation factor 4E type 2 [Tritrichomonas foetus]|eukprot:OHT12058.1 Eukaryotic translation initiation factor 4E type 2 [Tritrichomonas foetus]